MTRANMGWFDVDKEGLAKIMERRGGKTFAIFELIQNGWDQNVMRVDVSLTPVDGRPAAMLVVEDDDPEGFADLSHAFTLFAESVKKSDPSKRGRFNLGEKLVLACCNLATITTTTGAVEFASTGRRRPKTFVHGSLRQRWTKKPWSISENSQGMRLPRGKGAQND